MTPLSRKKIVWGLLIAVLGLLGGGLLISTDPRIASARREFQAQATRAWSRLVGLTELETALQQMRTAYGAEQAKTRTFAQKADELSKGLEQAQARVTTLEEHSKASEQERQKLEADRAKLETALRELQAAYAAEQAQTNALTQQVDELSRALEQAQARAKTLEDRQTDLVALHHALGNGYTKRGMNHEAVKAFQTALKLDPNHAETHYDLARIYLEHLNDREAAVSHLRRYVQLRPDAQDAERVKGWLMKVERELKVKKAVK